jgi:hypothetical protein
MAIAAAARQRDHSSWFAAAGADTRKLLREFPPESFFLYGLTNFVGPLNL